MHGTHHLHSRYEVAGVLLSSAGRGWRGISAELRSHGVGEIPGYEPSLTEIGVLIRGESVVTRHAHGIRQRIVASPGTIGIVPVGVREDFAHVSKFIDEIVHIYLSLDSFNDIAKHMARDFRPGGVRYDAGFQDPLIEGIAVALVGELRDETSCGDLLAETLADTLAMRLLTNYSICGGRALSDRAQDKGARFQTPRPRGGLCRLEPDSRDNRRPVGLRRLAQPFSFFANVQGGDRALAEPVHRHATT